MHFLALKNKKILITGATGGIGNSLVEKFYESAAIIVATGTTNEDGFAILNIPEQYLTNGTILRIISEGGNNKEILDFKSTKLLLPGWPYILSMIRPCWHVSLPASCQILTFRCIFVRDGYSLYSDFFVCLKWAK